MFLMDHQLRLSQRNEWRNSNRFHRLPERCQLRSPVGSFTLKISCYTVVSTIAGCLSPRNMFWPPPRSPSRPHANWPKRKRMTPFGWFRMTVVFQVAPQIRPLALGSKRWALQCVRDVSIARTGGITVALPEHAKPADLGPDR